MEFQPGERYYICNSLQKIIECISWRCGLEYYLVKEAIQSHKEAIDFTPICPSQIFKCSLLSSDANIFGFLDLLIFQELYEIGFFFEDNLSHLNVIFFNGETQKNHIVAYISLNNKYELTIYNGNNMISNDWMYSTNNKSFKDLNAMIERKIKKIKWLPFFSNRKNKLKSLKKKVKYSNWQIWKSEEQLNVSDQKYGTQYFTQEHSFFHPKTITTENFNTSYDCDGLSGYVSLNEFPFIFADKKNISVNLCSNTKIKARISKTEVGFLGSEAFCKTSNSNYIFLGVIPTELGVLDLFLILNKKINNINSYKVDFWNSFKAFLFTKFSDCNFYTKISANRVVDSFSISQCSNYYALEIPLDYVELITGFLQTKYSEKSCLFFKCYGQKDLTFTTRATDLLRKITNVFSLGFLPSLRIDICKSFYPIPKKNDTLSAVLSGNSFSSNAKNTYNIFRNEKITNINLRTFNVKNGTLSIHRNGSYKHNIYATFTRKLLNNDLLRLKMPINSIKVLKSNFYGFSCTSSTFLKKLEKKINKNLIAMNRHINSNYPIRFEITCNTLSIFEAEEYFNIHQHDMEINVINNTLLVGKLQNLMSCLEKILEGTGNSLTYIYNCIIVELFIIEFLIRGGRNPHILPSTFTRKFLDFDIESTPSIIEQFEIHDNELVQLEMINTIKKLVLYTNKITQDNKSIIFNILSISELPQFEVCKLIFYEFITNCKHFSGAIDLCAIDQSKKISSESIFIADYLKTNFSLKVGNLAFLPFSAMTKLALSMKILTENVLHEFLTDEMSNMKNLHVLNDKINYGRTRSKMNILIKLLFSNIPNEVENLMKEFTKLDGTNRFIIITKIYTKNNKLIRRPYSSNEHIRLLYGYFKYKNCINLYSRIKEDFMLGFFIGRSQAQLKDAIKNLTKRPDFQSRLEESKNFDIFSFSLQQHYEYLVNLGIVFTPKGVEAYNRLYEIFSAQFREDYTPKKYLIEKKNYFDQLFSKLKDIHEVSKKTLFTEKNIFDELLKLNHRATIDEVRTFCNEMIGKNKITLFIDRYKIL